MEMQSFLDIGLMNYEIKYNHIKMVFQQLPLMNQKLIILYRLKI